MLDAWLLHKRRVCSELPMYAYDWADFLEAATANHSKSKQHQMLIRIDDAIIDDDDDD